MIDLANLAPIGLAAILGTGMVTPKLLAKPAGHRYTDRAQWAKSGDLRSLWVPPEGVPGRLPLGLYKRRYLAAPRNHSVLVFGPTGSGKTESLVEPGILRHPGPALVTSVKRDVIDATIGYRSTLGPVWIFDPLRSTGYPCATWSPLASCHNYKGAKRMARWLVTAAQPTGDFIHSDAAQFFLTMTPFLLAPLMHAAALAGRTMTDVLRWVTTQDRSEAESILATQELHTKDTKPLNHLRLPEKLAASNGSLVPSMYATALTVLAVYDDYDDYDDVPDSTAASVIDVERLLDEHGTLFLVSPEDAQTDIGPLLQALARSVIRVAQGRAAAGQLSGLLVMLDEAGNTAPIRNLPGLATTARGLGIQLVSIWHSMGQVEQHFGGLAGTLIDNHQFRLYLPGIGDLGTLGPVSHLLGDTDAERVSRTKSNGGVSTTSGTEPRKLIPPEALRQLKLGQALLVPASMRPALVRVLPASGDRRLRDRYNLPVATRP